MINATNQISSDPQVGAGANVSDTSEAAATAASDFDSFLKLLTAQLRNQDPLSPLDSTQFVEQLASFSSVEQQIETNKKLDALTSGLAGSDLEAATQWIGKEVEIANSTAQFTGDPLTFGVPESAHGDGLRAYSVTNSVGDVVYRAPISTGLQQFTWDGKTSAGGAASPGSYSVAVSFLNEDGSVAETKQPLAYARVNEARLTDTDVKLLLSNGAIIDTSDIRAVKAPEEEPSTGV